MSFLHNWYSASDMESEASINAKGSIRICGASSPTNWQRTFSAKQKTLKLASLKGWVIPEVTRVATLQVRVCNKGEGWPMGFI